MTTQTPLVSVCIANYNGMEVIDDCLKSLDQQLGGVSFEVWVHDDASTDSSVAHIRERYPHVHLIASEMNVGFCVSNNRMAARAQGQFLLLLNNDAALFPDALQTLLTDATRDTSPAILTLPQYDATSGALVDRGCLLDPFFNPVPNLNPERRDVAMVIGACLWVPKSLWDELEGFPEWFGSIAEDMYLCCRARLAGYAIRALPASGYRHWQGKSFGGGKVVGTRMSTTVRRRALSERNKTLVMLINCPPALLVLLLPLHLIMLALEGIAMVLAGQSLSLGREIYLNCFIAMWRLKHQTLALRRDVQSHRKLGIAAFAAVFQPTPYKLQMLLRFGFPEVRS